MDRDWQDFTKAVKGVYHKIVPVTGPLRRTPHKSFALKILCFAKERGVSLFSKYFRGGTNTLKKLFKSSFHLLRPRRWLNYLDHPLTVKDLILIILALLLIYFAFIKDNKVIAEPVPYKAKISPVEPLKASEIKKQAKAVPVAVPKPKPTPAPVRASGNGYSYGYCTAWVKDRLPWVRNGWHNAYQWGYYAPLDGFRVHSTPVVESVAWDSGNHVAVVERVSDGQVYVSEKNYQGWNILSYRWTPINYWTGFIY